MMFNLGERPKQTYSGKRPSTRMGTAAVIRGALIAAENYSRKARNAKKDEPGPDRDLKHEALAKVLDRKVTAVFTAQRTDDILTSLRLINEFKLKGTVALAADGYLIRERLKQAKLPVIVHPTMQRVGGIETYNSFLGNAAALADAGIPIAVSSAFEGYVPKTRVIRHEASVAMVYGLGFERALRAITLDAANILGIADRYGSVEAGKTADLVLYDGDPFEHKTQVTAVLVNGRVAYDRAKRPPLSIARRMFLSAPERRCCLGF
jgi:imidazolonepropionase-like amidohydrolase